MGHTLGSASQLSCPHGGTVSIVSTSPASASGTPVATTADTFTIAGCPFTLPGPKPSPCVRVLWLIPDLRVTSGGNPTLSRSSIGLCLSADSIPQGTVTVTSTQERVSST